MKIREHSISGLFALYQTSRVHRWRVLIAHIPIMEQPPELDVHSNSKYDRLTLQVDESVQFRKTGEKVSKILPGQIAVPERGQN